MKHPDSSVSEHKTESRVPEREDDNANNMHPESSASEHKPESGVPEMENDPANIINQPQEATESPDPPASTTEAESEDQLRIFVAVLTVRVLNKCHALRNRSQEECIARTKRLITQTMAGLHITTGFCPDVKSTKKLSKSVAKDVQKQLGGKRLLESAAQDEAVDQVIVRCLLVNIRELSTRLAKKATSPDTWRDVVKLFAIATVTLVSVFVLAVLLL